MLFTPRTKQHVRLTMDLSPEDMKKIKRGRWRATVTDQITQTVYRVKGVSCGLPYCMCDAMVLETIR